MNLIKIIDDKYFEYIIYFFGEYIEKFKIKYINKLCTQIIYNER